MISLLDSRALVYDWVLFIFNRLVSIFWCMKFWSSHWKLLMRYLVSALHWWSIREKRIKDASYSTSLYIVNLKHQFLTPYHSSHLYWVEELEVLSHCWLFGKLKRKLCMVILTFKWYFKEEKSYFNLSLNYCNGLFFNREISLMLYFFKISFLSILIVFHFDYLRGALLVF